MKYRIHFTWPSGSEDNVCIPGETVEEVRANVKTWFESRWMTPGENNEWSEKIED